jgi:type VI secretion system protein ImpM
MSRHEAPGWYGKLATQGDFASRRLAHDWVQACDDWLSQCVAASRQQLSHDWLQIYLSAPVWRFAWGPGIADSGWWFGVLMPSCDSVGRYFPLVVAQPRAHAPADRIALDHLELWWSHVARAALDTLSEGATLESFEDALHHAPPWPGSGAMALPPVAPGAPADGRWRQSMPPGVALSDLAFALAAGGLQQRMSGSTFWWPMAPLGAAGNCTLAAGLPPPEAFAEMLRGAW